MTGVQHLGIPVFDLKDAVDWYTKKLGFQSIHEKIIVNTKRIDAALVKRILTIRLPQKLKW